MAASYTTIWEFNVMPGAEAEFRRMYGTGGPWVELFLRAPGYIGSLLLEDRATPGRYLTIDRWQSEEAFQAFRAQYAQQYEDLDLRCEALTLRETQLGTFEEHRGVR